MAYSPPPEGYMSVRDIANKANVSKSTVLRAIENEELPGLENSEGRVFVPDKDAQAWIDSRTTLIKKERD